MKILVVDDYFEITELAKLWLNKHEVTCFTEPEKALREATIKPFDTCLVDFSLGHRVSGNGLIAGLRLLQPKIKCILMTGSILPEELDKYEHNWDVILSKPEDFNEETLKRIFDNKENTKVKE